MLIQYIVVLQTFISNIVKKCLRNMPTVSHLTWNPARQHAAATVTELLGNELVMTQNVTVAC
jgi:hypothetical protein